MSEILARESRGGKYPSGQPSASRGLSPGSHPLDTRKVEVDLGPAQVTPGGMSGELEAWTVTLIYGYSGLKNTFSLYVETGVKTRGSES